MSKEREVDLQGNCSKCGGVHFGTGPDCVYGKPEQNRTIPPTLQGGREQPAPGEPSRCPTCGWPSRRLPANTSSEPDCTDPFHGGASQKPYHAPNCNHIKRDMIPRREIYRHVERIAGMTVTQIDYDYMGEPFTKPDAKPVDIFAHVLRAIEDFEPSSPPAPAGTAREFYISTNKGLLPSQADWTPDGAMKFAEDYAAERERQTREEQDDAFETQRQEIEALKSEVEQLRQERDALKREVDKLFNRRGIRK